MDGSVLGLFESVFVFRQEWFPYHDIVLEEEHITGSSRRSSLAPWDTASGFYRGLLGVDCTWLRLCQCAPRT